VKGSEIADMAVEGGKKGNTLALRPGGESGPRKKLVVEGEKTRLSAKEG